MLGPLGADGLKARAPAPAAPAPPALAAAARVSSDGYLASFASLGSILKPAVLAGVVGSWHRRARRRELKQAKAVRTKLLAGFKVEEWRRGFFEPDDTEQGFYFIEDVDMPADLCGTFFRNGPGKFQAGKDMVTHQLDGDGLVLAISFDPDEKRVCVCDTAWSRLKDCYVTGMPRECLQKDFMAPLQARVAWALTLARMCQSILQMQQ